MTLHLTDETASLLTALAADHGLSVEEYLKQLVEREMSDAAPSTRAEGSGMVWENGLFVYRTGNRLPASVVDEALRRSREQRAEHILCRGS